MSVFKLTLAYDGTDFHGWQRQPNQRTVQGELERAWAETTGETPRMAGASRTDAGVHAAGQVASIQSDTRLEPAALLAALNARLPDDLVVRSVEAAAEGFHATHHARRKRYRYSFYCDRRRPVFARRFVWHVPAALDAAAMHRAAQALVGTHDFSSFQSVGSERESTVRTIFAAEVRDGAGRGRGGAAHGPSDPSDSNDAGAGWRLDHELGALIELEIEGDGFLYNMVRAIAGTLVDVGRGRRDPDSLADVISAHDRSAAGQTAPAHGLTLLWVAY